MAYPDFSALKKIYNHQMDLVLSSIGLTTRCDFNFGTTNLNVCPNCIYDVSLKKSSGKYKLGGPAPFILGKICPYCNGIGAYGVEKITSGYLAVIWDYKKWINPPPQINNPNGFIQTICDKTYLSDIKQCKDMTVVYNTTGSNPVFKLYGEPNPAGLGDNNYLFCMWEKIGMNNKVSTIASPSVYVPSSSGTWTQIGSDINGEAINDYSGWSVSLNNTGYVLAIGAVFNDSNGNTNSGHARVYSWNGSSWTQTGNDIDGTANDDNSGFIVSINSSGNVLAIGSPYNDNNGYDSGAVRVYRRSGSSWNQIGTDINGLSSEDLNGYSISLNDSGNIIAIGAIFNDNIIGTNAGTTRVYKLNGSTWTALGNNINGENANDYSGWSVCLNSTGDILAIGATYNDNSNVNSGHVRIYSWNGSSWVQLGSDIDGENINDASGYSVSINDFGNVVAIGAIYNDSNGTDSGHVRVYSWNGSTWTQIGNDIDGEATGDNSGFSISLNGTGNILAIGARYNDGNGTNSGHTRVYYWNNNIWIKLGNDIDGEAIGDQSGYSVSLNNVGDILAIGSINNDENGLNSGSARIYKYA